MLVGNKLDLVQDNPSKR